MNRVQGLTVFLAALCVSAIAIDSAFAQDSAPSAQSEPAVSPDVQSPDVQSPDAQDSSGWLLRGRNQNRNPFRTTPAPSGVKGFQENKQTDTRFGPNLPSPPSVAAPAEPTPAEGTSCLIGYWRRGAQCTLVVIPEHATLDLTGHNWMCERGFVRRGQGCIAIQLPENASLDPAGNSWVCNYGYRRNANGCAAVAVPEHASLDDAGHTWRCNEGYEQRGALCIDAATVRLQKEANKAVAAGPRTASKPLALPRTGVTVNSGDTRRGRSNKAKVVIGRF